MAIQIKLCIKVLLPGYGESKLGIPDDVHRPNIRRKSSLTIREGLNVPNHYRIKFCFIFFVRVEEVRLFGNQAAVASHPGGEKRLQDSPLLGPNL